METHLSPNPWYGYVRKLLNANTFKLEKTCWIFPKQMTNRITMCQRRLRFKSSLILICLYFIMIHICIS